MYGIYSDSLSNSINEQYDKLREPFLKCKTKAELKEALRPHVEKIYHRYDDYVVSPRLVDSIKSDLYILEQSVYHISVFGMDTIDKAVKEILREQ